MATALTSWGPFSDVAELRRRFDRLFEEPGDDAGTWFPSVDLVRSDQDLTLKADLPGLTSDEVQIEVDDGILTVSGEHTEELKSEKEHYMRRERRSGAFRRSMALPEGVEADQIEAEFHEGVLEVKIPLPEKGGERGPVKITPKTG